MTLAEFCDHVEKAHGFQFLVGYPQPLDEGYHSFLHTHHGAEQDHTHATLEVDWSHH